MFFKSFEINLVLHTSRQPNFFTLSNKHFKHFFLTPKYIIFTPLDWCNVWLLFQLTLSVLAYINIIYVQPFFHKYFKTNIEVVIIYSHFHSILNGYLIGQLHQITLIKLMNTCIAIYCDTLLVILLMHFSH